MSAKADGLTCSSLFEAKHAFNETLYRESLDKEKASESDQISPLFSKLERGEIVQIEEVLAMLDSQLSTNEKLFDQVTEFSKNPTLYKSSLLNIFKSPIRIKRGKIVSLQSDFKSEEQVKKFISALLKSLYKIQKKTLRLKILELTPNRDVRFNMLSEIDSFYYANRNVFDDYLVLPKRDAFLPLSWINAITDFYLFFSDPIMSHRLNLNDSQLSPTDLSVKLNQRLTPILMSQYVRQKILLATLATSVVLLPINISKAYHGIELFKAASGMIIGHVQEISDNVNHSYQDNMKKQIQAQIDHYQDLKKQALKRDPNYDISTMDLAIAEYEKYLVEIQNDQTSN